ncbi:MAG: hypothetical protein ACREML_02885, partial [Vulcanimicrobiaceae bacterium]
RLYIGTRPDRKALATALLPDAIHTSSGAAGSVFAPNSADVVWSEIADDRGYSVDPAHRVRCLRVDEASLLDSLDTVRPGGVCVAWVHGNLIDRPVGALRFLVHSRADLLAAVRLPEQILTAGSAGLLTLLVWRKRVPGVAPGPDTLATVDRMTLNGHVFFVQQHFALARSVGHSYYGRYAARFDNAAQCWRLSLQLKDEAEARVLPEQGRQTLNAAFSSMREQLQLVRPEVPRLLPAVQPAHLPMAQDWFTAPELAPDAVADPRDRALAEGHLYLRAEGVYAVHTTEAGERDDQLVVTRGARATRLVRILDIRNGLHDLYRLESDAQCEEIAVSAARATLNRVYDDFVRHFGPLAKPENHRLFEGDPEAGRVAALELYDEDSGQAKKSEVFAHRVMARAESAVAPQTVAEALVQTLGDTLHIDVPRIAAELGMTPEAAGEELLAQGLAYYDHGACAWKTAAEYLSGDVRAKARVAERWIERDPKQRQNLDALRRVMPTDIPIDKIFVQLGSHWITPELIAQFMESAFGAQHGKVSVNYQPATNHWDIVVRGSLGTRQLDFATPRVSALRVLECALNCEVLRVYDQVDDSQVLNADATIEANDKLSALQEAFRRFSAAPERRAQIEQAYNERMNSMVPPHYDGRHLRFAGMSAAIRLRPAQRNAVARFLFEGNLLCAHEVGLGKTYTQVACAMEARRLGRARKPVWVVPNHLLEKSEREANRLYPYARILTVTSRMLRPQHIGQTVRRIANADWDLVLIRYSAFDQLAGRSGAVEKRELELRLAEEELLGATGRRHGAVLHSIRRLNRDLEKLRATQKTSAHDYWAEMGVDMLMVDEAHNYKNLEKDSSGLEWVRSSQTGSERAARLFTKINNLYEANGRVGNVVFATGTPIANQLDEIYNMQRYLQPDRLRDMGIYCLRGWLGTFSSTETRWEPDVTGQGFRQRSRVVLRNVPELMSIFRHVADVASAEDAGITRPQLERENVVIAMNSAQTELMQTLAQRVEAIRKRSVPRNLDNLLKIVTDGRKLGLDARLLDLNVGAVERDKVHVCATHCAREYAEHAEERGVQLVFCDIGLPNADGRWNVYDELKEALMTEGIPADEIAFASDYKTDADKARLFEAARRGEKRIVIGSTYRMGEGVNIQDRACALHDLDAP